MVAEKSRVRVSCRRRTARLTRAIPASSRGEGAEGRARLPASRSSKEVIMTELSSLWLPILLSAVIVFVASSIIHMASPWHKSDYPKMPNEDQVMEALRPLAIPPGDYFVPRPASREEMRSAEFKEKARQGPVFVMTMMPTGQMSMA